MSKIITDEELIKLDSFDASKDSDGFIFVIDADKDNKMIIENFSEKDALKFINTATNNIEDIKFCTRDYDNGESVLVCGGVDIELKKLKTSRFWNVESFKEIFGDNSLVVGG